MKAKAIAEFDVAKATGSKVANSSANASGSGVKIEQQRGSPEWTDSISYEHYREQTEFWNSKNNTDETSKYYDVLENLKKNDKIPGLKEYIGDVVCEKMSSQRSNSGKTLGDIRF